MSSASDLSHLSREALIERILDLQAESNALSRQLRASGRLIDATSPVSGGGGGGHVDPSSSSHTAASSSSHGLRRGSVSMASDAAISPAAARLSTHRLEQQQRKKMFEISMSVMVIENGSALSVPLSAVLDKTYGREDLRDADTPVVGAKFLRDMDSIQTQRFSVGSTSHRNTTGEGGGGNNNGGGGGRMGDVSPSMNLDEEFADAEGIHGSNLLSSGGGGIGRASGLLMRGSGHDDEDDEPLPQDPHSGPTAIADAAAATLAARAGVSRLNLKGGLFLNRDLSLDADAIVSGHTLRLFNQQFGRDANILSPLSSYGNAVYHYIVKTFAVRNGCQHSPDDVEGFGRTLISLCTEVRHILQGEPRHTTMASPCYVFGDLHGNFRDLFYFMDNLISFQDLRYTPHRFMFLGDYVDRGEFSVEVVAYLFAMKVLAPEKVLLLRGNHEDTLVSGDIGGYGNTSFRAQCHGVFGAALGEEVWHRASETFSHLPLTANIDGKIYCTHGGIPRYRGGVDDRMDLLRSADFPPMQSFFQVPEGESQQHQMFRQVGMDTCWADPAENEGKLDKWGFGSNPRGTGVILFGAKAVEDFLDHFGYEYIFRAHQEKADGLKLSKSARVFTIFSTSAYVGHQNGAGVVLVADGKIRLIVKNADTYEEEDREEGDFDDDDDHNDDDGH